MTDKPQSAVTDFAATLKGLRLQAGLTQEALASLAGMSQDAVASLERGRRTRPRVETVTLLADALELRGHLRSNFVIQATGGEVPQTSDQRLPDALSPAPASIDESLFGRDDDVERVLELVRNERLITLWGPGGIGKTRLAEAVGRRASAWPGQQVFFVDLSAIRDGSLLSSAIGQVVAPGAGSGDSIDEVLKRLVTGPVLLILDNFEQLLEATAQVPAMLKACPEMVILITSRTALRIRGERRFPVHPLRLPPSNASEREVAENAAVRLFLARSVISRSESEIDAATLEAVAEICRRLDGLPLAIELAAARSRVLPPQSMVSRLQRRLQILTSRDTEVSPRHRSLRAALDWSRDFLSEEELGLFMRLGAFEGGATLEAIADVCEMEDDDVLGALESLVDESLIFEMGGIQGTGRFGMLQTIHEYANDLLAASGEEATVRRRHVDFYIRLAEEARSHLTGPEQAEWLPLLDREMRQCETCTPVVPGCGRARARSPARSSSRRILVHVDAFGGRPSMDDWIFCRGLAIHRTPKPI